MKILQVDWANKEKSVGLTTQRQAILKNLILMGYSPGDFTDGTTSVLKMPPYIAVYRISGEQEIMVFFHYQVDILAAHLISADLVTEDVRGAFDRYGRELSSIAFDADIVVLSDNT
jgi:hypothetical protein